MVSVEWDLAGFTDPVIGAGEISIWEPVTLDEGRSSIISSLASRKTIKPSPKMLNDFVLLWDEPAELVLRYASKWGLLWLSNEGRPCAKSVSAPHAEPVQTWRYFSRRAKAILDLAALLHQGKKPTAAQWEPLGELRSVIGMRAIKYLTEEAPGLSWCIAERGFPEPAKQTLEIQRGLLAYEITIWLKLGRVGLVAGPGVLEIDLHHCMFSAIALQLALTIAGTNRLFTCSGCGYPYSRKNKAPKPHQANFCPRCGPEALRQADQRRRKKMADARHLKQQGLSVSKIAKQLGTEIATVKGWIKK
jgi:ssDNA-binding Zn-finger/Zn-ribbon topoisomerase 1